MNAYPMSVRARQGATPSRWLWLVKWVLLVPHYLVLVALWIAFVALTLVGYVAVLINGRLPRSIFNFNVGVMRWSWRVGYYGYQALGTDRYPPFTLAEVPDYPAGLQIDYPEQLPRWRVFSWLLAVPHLLILAGLTGTTWQLASEGSTGLALPAGVLGAGILVVGCGLLFGGRHPGGLYDLLIGVNRWSMRVLAYVGLLSGGYPPFRLDQGDAEPVDGPLGPPPTPDPTGTVATSTAAPTAPTPRSPEGTTVQVG